MKDFKSFKKRIELELGIGSHGRQKIEPIELELGIGSRERNTKRINKNKLGIGKRTGFYKEELFSFSEFLRENGSFPPYKKKKKKKSLSSENRFSFKHGPREKKYLKEHGKKHDEKFSTKKEQSDLHRELKKHHKYDGNHKETIEAYTNESNHLNNHLANRKGKFSNKHKENIDATDNMVNHHKSHKSFHVYTGVGKTRGSALVKAARKTHESGETHFHAVHHGYTSTSIDHSIAHKFSTGHGHSKPKGESHHHVLKIKVPKGHHGAYVAHHSFHANEKEHILPRGIKLKIHKTPHTIKTHRDAWGDKVSGPDHPDFHTTEHIHHWNATIEK